MQDLITDYQLSRAQLQHRIMELNQMLKTPALSLKDRERLAVRRNLLMTEREEMLIIITEMEKHLKGAESHEKSLRNCHEL